MKKFLSILCITIVAIMPVSAAITTEESTSQQYIESHGYSTEMARLIDLQNAHVNGAEPKYKGTDPAWYADKKVNFIRKVFMYFDPGVDDEKFGQNKIKYTTRYDDL